MQQGGKLGPLGQGLGLGLLGRGLAFLPSGPVPHPTPTRGERCRGVVDALQPVLFDQAGRSWG